MLGSSRVVSFQHLPHPPFPLPQLDVYGLPMAVAGVESPEAVAVLMERNGVSIQSGVATAT